MKNKFPILGAVFALSIVAQPLAASVVFTEDFTSPTLDAAWNIQGST